MLYLTKQDDIKEIILDLCEVDYLWLDTEVADYNTKNPQLSLIQMLAHPDNLDGSRTYLLDVLGKPELIEFFIEQIMKNQEIIKVFHNAKYDLKFLGKTKAKNVICTLELAKEIPYYLLPVSSYSLKNLTEYLTQFKQISKEQQTSNWGTRPLSFPQLKYAQMDCIYLREIYYQLLQLQTQISPNPLEENLELLAQEYQKLEKDALLITSKMENIKERLKKAMIEQKQAEVQGIKLSSYSKTTLKTDFRELVRLVNTKNIDLDLTITLTKKMQNQIGDSLTEIEIDTQTIEVTRLITPTNDQTP